jgi:glycosyltransferase involved in cell wall biosynthesis
MSVRVRYFSKGTAADPGSRYRIYQYLPRLSALGVDVDVSPLFGDRYVTMADDRRPWRRAARRALAAARGYARRAAALRSAARFDLVVVERQLFPYLPALAELPLFRSRAPVTLEFDDAIHLTRGHGAKVARLVRAARRVVVGNAELARYAREAGAGAGAVVVVPTVVDCARYPVRGPRRPRSHLILGWVGLPYNLPSLEHLTGALARLAREVPLELRVISSRAPDMPGVPVRLVPWSAATEAADIADLDIGLMPLPDDPWHRGKCGLKLLQYMAAGVAAVASPVGVNAEIVEDGANGRLAAGETEWYEALRGLARDDTARARLGAAGRSTVEGRYSLDVWAPRLAAVYREAAA